MGYVEWQWLLSEYIGCRRRQWLLSEDWLIGEDNGCLLAKAIGSQGCQGKTMVAGKDNDIVKVGRERQW